MKFDSQQWQILGLVANLNLLTVPAFQRQSEIWPIRKKELFMDTIIKGWKTPKLYLNNSQEQKYEIVDGQQRIVTILEFLSNLFKIELPELSGKKYFKELDEIQQKNILDYKLDVEIIREATDEEVAQLYSRLQEGMALNPAEKIHAITGKLSTFIDNMEKHAFFDKTGFRKKRYGVKGICQQMCYLEIVGIDSVKYPNLREF